MGDFCSRRKTYGNLFRPSSFPYGDSSPHRIRLFGGGFPPSSEDAFPSFTAEDPCREENG